jgi:addiction module RelE/StbE family toxin
MKIIYSPKFAREYKKLLPQIKLQAEKAETVFRKNAFDPKLKTHKLSGRLGEFWSFSIDYKYRIIFEFGETDVVYFHSVGNHDIYQ